MATEDTFIINVDTKTGQVSLDKLQKKINSIYGGINKLAGTKELPSKGITRYTFEVMKAKKAVADLTNANRALQSSYPKNISTVTGKFIAGRKGKTPAQVVTKAAAKVTGPENIYGSGKAVAHPLIPSVPFLSTPDTQALALKKAQRAVQKKTARTTQGIKSSLAKGVTKEEVTKSFAPITLPQNWGDISKFSKFTPKSKPVTPLPTLPVTKPYSPDVTKGMPEGLANALDVNNLFPQSEQIAKQSMRINKMLASTNKPVVPKTPITGNEFKNIGIQSLGYGDKRFKPGVTVAEKRRTPFDFQATQTGRTLKKLNMGLFKLQMASLGVFFSFMGIQNAITGLFSGLQNLGGTFKSQAMGKAFGGVDVAGAMGIGGGDLVQGWKNITGILGMVQTAMAALAATALTPEVMTAIQIMFIELGKALADGKVAKALGDIIIAFTQFVVSVLPVIPIIADLISILGDTGLLPVIIGLIMSAQYLLAGLSLLGFVLQGITSIIASVAAIAASWGVTVVAAFGLIVGAIVLVLIAIDFLINVWENFAATGDIVGSIVNGLTDTFWDLYNILLPFLNFIGGFIGMDKRAAATTHSGEYASSQKSVVNNYNFNGNYDDPNTMLKKTQKGNSTSYT